MPGELVLLIVAEIDVIANGAVVFESGSDVALDDTNNGVVDNSCTVEGIELVDISASVLTY